MSDRERDEVERAAAELFRRINRQFAPLQEALRHFERPIQNFEERMLGPIKQLSQGIASIVAPESVQKFALFAERFASIGRWWVEEAPEQLKLALEKAGTIPHPELTLQDLSSLVLAAQDHGPDAAVKQLRVLHEELLASDHFRQNLAKRWSKARRRPILDQILAAHDAGLYAVSVPAALAHAEGVVADLTNHQGHMDGEALADHLSTLGARHSLYQPIVSHFVNQFLLAKFAHGKPVPQFSRHAILHGGDIDYGTKDNSIAALVWLDFLAILANEEPEGSSEP